MELSNWFKIGILFFLGGLLLLGLFFIIFFGVKVNQQPNEDWDFISVNLTNEEKSQVLYENIGGSQPVLAGFSFQTGDFNSLVSDRCTAEVTMETKKGNISQTIKFDPDPIPDNGYSLPTILVGKKVTKVTIDLIDVEENGVCRLNFEGVNGSDLG